jgi:hypothetical protein
MKAKEKTKAHIRYRNKEDKIVVGVTTALNVLSKPALIPWANRLGLQGIDSTKYVDDKADIGTCCHYLIECDLKSETPDLKDYAPAVVNEAENGFLKFLEWKKAHIITSVKSEIQLVSEVHQYGGTIDIYAELDGKPTLIDIKTSGSGIWPEMKHQVSAYKQLLEENGHKVDKVMILRVGRSEDEGFEYAEIGNLDKHFELFLHCLAIYNIRKTIDKS